MPPLKISKPVLLTLIFAVGVTAYLYLFAGKKAPVMQPSASPVALIQQPVTDKTSRMGQESARVPDGVRLRLQKQDMGWQRDPFVLPAKITGELSEQPALRLLGIVGDVRGGAAIVDDEVVRQGDLIGVERIQEIRDDSVVLVYKGFRRVLKVEELPVDETLGIEMKRRGQR
jgi:hypothetical protein